MRKCFVVLGMHRSATSLAAKGLHEAGIYMGSNLLGSHPSNPHGHYEDRDFIQLNDRILKMAGGSWDKPPPESDIVVAGGLLDEMIRNFITNKQDQSDLWGWKDPRTTLTIRAYVAHLVNPHFITCWRKPSEVARSLEARDGMPLEKGIELAATYNQRLYRFLEEWTNGYQ